MDKDFPAEAGPLQLPELDESSLVGAKLVRRVIPTLILVLSIVTAVGVVLSFVVDVNLAISAHGILEHETRHEVHSPESGVIERVFIVSGDTVKAGQVLLEFDTSRVAAEVRSLKSEAAMKLAEFNRFKQSLVFESRQQSEAVIQASARLLKARANFRRSIAEYQLTGDADSIMNSYKVGAHVGLDVAYAEMVSCEAEVRSAGQRKDAQAVEKLRLEEFRFSLDQMDAKVNLTCDRLRRLEVHSISDGIVLGDQLEHLLGTYVREGDLLMRIVDPRCWQATLMLDERDIHRVKIGAVVDLELPALRSNGFGSMKGLVNSVSSEPTGSGTAKGDLPQKTYRVRVAIDSKEADRRDAAGFRQGFTVVGRITTEERPMYQIIWNGLTKRDISQ